MSNKTLPLGHGARLELAMELRLRSTSMMKRRSLRTIGRSRSTLRGRRTSRTILR